MALRDEIRTQARSIFRTSWPTPRAGRVVPTPSSLGLGNEAVEFEEAAILYADLNGSTKLVDNHYWSFAAEIYKTFLYAAARIIRNGGGEITAYDGDRIMAVFIGDDICVKAVNCALRLNYCVENILQDEMK